MTSSSKPHLVDGSYVAIIDGRERRFSCLSDAISAHDSHIVQQKGWETKREDLMKPEKWKWLFEDSDPVVENESESVEGTGEEDEDDQHPPQASDSVESSYREQDDAIVLYSDESSYREEEKRCKPQLQLKAKGSSSYRGVHWQKNRKKWMARYSLAHRGEKNINLGAFEKEKHAALAFDVEARRQGLSDEYLNFPNENPTSEDVDSWKTKNKYKKMKRNGKSSSKYRGVAINGNAYRVQCHIKAVVEGLGTTGYLGEYHDELVSAHVFDYVCRRYGVPEHELNFPLGGDESRKMTREALAGAREASRVISMYRSGEWGKRIQSFNRSSKKRVPRNDDGSSDEESIYSATSDVDELDDKKTSHSEEENDLYEVEAFVARPFPGSIEVKFVGSHSKVIKAEAELIEQLDSEGFLRFAHLLDRRSPSERSKLDEDVCHDDECMVCNDGGDLMCCETCPCVVHASCVGISQKHYSGSRSWRCAICRHQAPTILSLPKSASDDNAMDRIYSDNDFDDYEEQEYLQADCMLSEDDINDYELDDDAFGDHPPVRQRKAKKKGSKPSGNRSGAKPVDMEAAASMGLPTANTLDITHMDEYQALHFLQTRAKKY